MTESQERHFPDVVKSLQRLATKGAKARRKIIAVAAKAERAIAATWGNSNEEFKGNVGEVYIHYAIRGEELINVSQDGKSVSYDLLSANEFLDEAGALLEFIVNEYAPNSMVKSPASEPVAAEPTSSKLNEFAEIMALMRKTERRLVAEANDQHKQQPTQTDFVERKLPFWTETPPDHAYNLTMFESNDSQKQSVAITRKEFMILKQHLAKMRGYTQEDLLNLEVEECRDPDGQADLEE